MKPPAQTLGKSPPVRSRRSDRGVDHYHVEIGDEVDYSRQGISGTYTGRVLGWTRDRLRVVPIAHRGQPVCLSARSIKPQYVNFILRGGLRLGHGHPTAQPLARGEIERLWAQARAERRGAPPPAPPPRPIPETPGPARRRNPLLDRMADSLSVRLRIVEEAAWEDAVLARDRRRRGEDAGIVRRRFRTEDEPEDQDVHNPDRTPPGFWKCGGCGTLVIDVPGSFCSIC